ncbi:MAG TPA: hypothetical protein VF310_10505, partial [Vicinamibacteria bacterium]
RFLELAAGASAAWATRARGQTAPIVTPRVNGGVNVQPLRRLDFEFNEGNPVILPGLVEAQLRAVYELGFDGIRVTAGYGDRANFLAAIPYVRAARALGIDAIVVLSNFSGFQLARALWDEKTRGKVLKLYDTVLAAPPLPVRPGLGGLGPAGVGRIAFQVLNEPALFAGIPPEVYVREILAPCFTELRRLNPQILVVSAAEVGTLDGPPRLRAMMEAGLENVIDRIAYHVYNPAIIPMLAPHVRNLVWVTESGVAGTERHLAWVRDTFPAIRAGIEDASRIFFFVLYEDTPRRFRLVDIQADGAGGFRVRRESAELIDHFEQNVVRAARGAPILPFATLVPDIRAYFPTVADIALYDEVYFG